MHYSSSITFSVDRSIIVSRANDEDDNIKNQNQLAKKVV